MIPKFISESYQIFIPKFIIEPLFQFRCYVGFKFLRRNIINYYSRLPTSQITGEHKEVLKYLKQNPVSVFPYPFTAKYSPENVEVLFDEQLRFHYVLFEDKRLYFKRSWSESKIKEYYYSLQLEQDINSPHRYLTDDFFVETNDVVVDAGAAEGNFALSVVDNARKIYLFETDKEWIEALRVTFEPWKEKVVIINKFLSDKNDEKDITLDYFFEKGNDISFLKIDVDGGEEQLLNGCGKILSSNQPLKVALCAYHKQNDEADFIRLLKSKGFEISCSKGYMIFIYDSQLKAPYLLKPPYLRRGIIRAKKRFYKFTN